MKSKAVAAQTVEDDNSDEEQIKKFILAILKKQRELDKRLQALLSHAGE